MDSIRVEARRPEGVGVSAASVALYGLVLIMAHATVDMAAGAKPALVQLFRANLGLSYTILGALVSAAALLGAAAQVTFGLAADARRYTWMPPAGVALVAIGLGATGVAFDAATAGLTFALIALGSALFHPEALRTMHVLSGERRVTAMANFIVGGSIGWALGPVLVATLTGQFGPRAMLWWLAVAMPIAAILYGAGRSLFSASRDASAQATAAGPDRWREYRLLFALVLLRAATHQALVIFFPGYLVDVAGESQAAAALSLSILLTGGIVTTPIIGRIADRWSRKGVVLATLGALTLLIALLPRLEGPVLFPVLFLTGAMSAGSLPVTLVMSQEYLPGRTALGGGLVLAASGIASFVATPLGVAADTLGLTAVLYMTAGLAVLAVICAAFLPGSVGLRGLIPDGRM